MIVKLRKNNKKSIIHKYADDGVVGADLFACIDEEIVLKPGKRCLVSTGISLSIPKGHEVQIRPRSGLANDYGITVLNSPGTIDPSFRGILGVILINHGEEDFIIEPKMKIAQAVCASYIRMEFEIVDELDDTDRGTGGFGSTGK